MDMEKFDYAGAVAELDRIAARAEDPSTGRQLPEVVEGTDIRLQGLSQVCEGQG